MENMNTNVGVSKELMKENEKEVIANLRFVRNLVFLCFAWRCETSYSLG